MMMLNIFFFSLSLSLSLERKLFSARTTVKRRMTNISFFSIFYSNLGASFNVKTFNAIAPTGLEKFPQGKYKVAGEESDLPGPPMAIMLRSHKLQVNEVKPTVRAIVRCGAGTNNIPVKEMGERGIPVFNTPGANANAVKELVVCGLLLASRGILEGANHVKNVINVEEKGEHEKIATRIEKDKAKFGGTEIQGKTIGVIGLGAIGSRYVVFFCCCVLYFYLLFFFLARIRRRTGVMKSRLDV